MPTETRANEASWLNVSASPRKTADAATPTTGVRSVPVAAPRADSLLLAMNQVT